jgi:putative ABC transport system substrate-binding protein
VAQPAGKVWRIGLVGSSTIPEDHLAAFRAGLAESGLTVGENVFVEYRGLGDRLSPLPEVVADFVRSAVDVIVAYGSPATLSAKTATQSIPIVMVGARDPVEQGIVASLARPGGNITGISAATGPSIASKRLALIKEAVPRASRIGHLWSSAFPGTKPHTEEMIRAGGPLKMTVTSFDVRGRDDLSSAFATMKRGGVDVVSVEAALSVYRKKIVELAAQSRLPAFYGSSLYVEAGGLMGYSADWREIFRRGGVYAAKILGGAKPTDLPVEQPTKFELLVNLKTAKNLGLTLPPSFLVQADRVLE